MLKNEHKMDIKNMIQQHVSEIVFTFPNDFEYFRPRHATRILNNLGQRPQIQ